MSDPEDTQALLAQGDYYEEESKRQVAPTKVDLVSEALVKCQGLLKAAEFDATNPFFKSKYATLGSVIAASREALFKSGLSVLQIPSIQGDLVSVHTRIVHESGQSIDCGVMSLSLGESDRNSDAQLAGSILTYLKRYAWASILGIYADADDDGNTGPKGAQKPPGAIPKQQGVSEHPPTPKSAPMGTPEAHGATPNNANTEKWLKYRMSVLNKLEAAPGQRNRVLLTDYLTDGGVLTPDQVLEDWPFKSIPATPTGIEDLRKKMQDYETLTKKT